MNIKTIEGNFDNPEVNKLLVKHFKELRSVSPENSCHVLDINGLKTESIKFWSLWENDGLVGCGALKFLENEHGELKSIRVTDVFKNIKSKKRSRVKPTGFILGLKNIYLSTSNGRLLVIDISSGETISTLKIDNEKISKPFVHNKNLFLIKNNAIIRLN